VAPDGSVYVADWYDPGVGGHGIGDFTRGRIYRLAPPGNRPSVPKVDLESAEGVLAALGSPALSVRYMAMAKLKSMDPERAVVGVLEKAITQRENPWLRARAVWQFARLNSTPSKTLWDDLVGLDDERFEKDARLRLLALRCSAQHKGALPVYRENALKDSSAAVARELLLTLRSEDPRTAEPVIWDLAKRYDGTDRFYLEAIGIAVGQDQERRAAILADFEKHFPEWNDKVADLVWELRPPHLLPQLEKRVVDNTHSPAQRARVVEILAAYEEPEAGKTLIKLLAEGAAPEVCDEIIKHLKAALSTKWAGLRQSPELSAAVNRLLGQSDTRATGLTLVRVAGRTDLAGKVADIAKDPKEPPSTRNRAVQTLGSLPTPTALAALQGLLQAEPVELRLEAVKALAGTRPGTEWLLAAAEKKQLPAALKDDVGRLVRNTPYRDLKIRAMVAFPAPGALDPNKLPDIAVLARRQGNAEHGKQLLAVSLTSDLQCLKCHTVRGVGGNIGPDLSVIGKKASRENLFESMLYPSKAIADQYVTWNIETVQGLSLSGLLVEETADHLALRDANGKDTRIDKKDVESRSKSPTSLMPNNLLVHLTADDLVDLVEYLFSLKTPVLALDWWHVLGPFDNGADDAGLDRPFGPEKGIDLRASYPGKSGPVRWRTVKPNAQGYVDLRAFLAPDSDNVVSYLYREVESPGEQEAVISLGTDDAARLWVNGSVVYTNRLHRAAVPDADTVKVKLKKGRNPLLLKITNGNGAHGFYLTLQAEQELKRVE
jgi:putative heme-binding domain-containing protein